MGVGEQLHVDHAGHVVEKHARLFHAIVQLVGDQEEAFDAGRDHHKGHGYADDGVDYAEDLAARGQWRHVAIAFHKVTK